MHPWDRQHIAVSSLHKTLIFPDPDCVKNMGIFQDISRCQRIHGYGSRPAFPCCFQSVRPVRAVDHIEPLNTVVKGILFYDRFEFLIFHMRGDRDMFYQPLFSGSLHLFKRSIGLRAAPFYAAFNAPEAGKRIDAVHSKPFQGIFQIPSKCFMISCMCL